MRPACRAGGPTPTTCPRRWPTWPSARRSSWSSGGGVPSVSCWPEGRDPGLEAKPVLARVRSDGPLLGDLWRRLALHVAEHYLAPPGLVVRAMLPPGTLERIALVAPWAPSEMARAPPGRRAAAIDWRALVRRSAGCTAAASRSTTCRPQPAGPRLLRDASSAGGARPAAPGVAHPGVHGSAAAGALGRHHPGRARDCRGAVRGGRPTGPPWVPVNRPSCASSRTLPTTVRRPRRGSGSVTAPER